MISLDVAMNNILSPAIMFFILGVISVLIKSDLEIPDSIGTVLTMFILISIGLKAGISVNKTGITGIILPIISSIIVGIVITFVIYHLMLRIGFDAANAGSIGGHYGACSSVTLTTVIVFLGKMGASYEQFVPAMYPFMDTAALISGIALGHAGLKKKLNNDEYSIANILRESLTSKSTVLIIGGLIIGVLAGPEGTEDLMPFYSTAFQGIFTIFMLDIGILAGTRIPELKNVKPIAFLIAIFMPPIQGTV
ncbi:MAG: sodium-dependent bicarbonate transport family permease, partial [Bacillota bacterium]